MRNSESCSKSDPEFQESLRECTFKLESITYFLRRQVGLSSFCRLNLTLRNWVSSRGVVEDDSARWWSVMLIMLWHWQSWCFATAVLFYYPGSFGPWKICRYLRKKNGEHSGQEGICKYLFCPNSGHFPLDEKLISVGFSAVRVHKKPSLCSSTFFVKENYPPLLPADSLAGGVLPSCSPPCFFWISFSWGPIFLRDSPKPWQLSELTNPVLPLLGLFENTKENLKNTKGYSHLANP